MQEQLKEPRIYNAPQINVNDQGEITNKRIYNLDIDSGIIREHFLNSPEFRTIEIHGKFFIQYRTLKLHQLEHDSLDKFIFYEKLADPYYFENEKGFDTFEQACDSLVKYLNAPKTAKLHPILLSKTKDEIVSEIEMK